VFFLDGEIEGGKEGVKSEGGLLGFQKGLYKDKEGVTGVQGTRTQSL